MVGGELMDTVHIRGEKGLITSSILDDETPTILRHVADPGEAFVRFPGVRSRVLHDASKNSRSAGTLVVSFGDGAFGFEAKGKHVVKTVLFTTIGAACLVRGLFRPTRALAKKGSIKRCAGTNSFGVCDPTLAIHTTMDAPIFSTVAGKVLVVGSDYVHVMANNEPVILMYQGVVPKVRSGQFVGPGQELGKSQGNVNFGVTQMGPGGTFLIPPSAWLAARGYKVLSKNMGDKSLWCAQNRNISVPREARQHCEFKTPQGAGFALLPVTVELN